MFFQIWTFKSTDTTFQIYLWWWQSRSLNMAQGSLVVVCDLGQYPKSSVRQTLWWSRRPFGWPYKWSHYCGPPLVGHAYSMVWLGFVWYGMVWNGISGPALQAWWNTEGYDICFVWYCMTFSFVWYGMVWHGISGPALMEQVWVQFMSEPAEQK